MFGEVEMIRCGAGSAPQSRVAVNPARSARCVVLMGLKLELHTAHARSSGRWKAILEIVLVENIVSSDKEADRLVLAEGKPIACAYAGLVNPAKAVHHRRYLAENRLQIIARREQIEGQQHPRRDTLSG